MTFSGRHQLLPKETSLISANLTSTLELIRSLTVRDMVCHQSHKWAAEYARLWWTGETTLEEFIERASKAREKALFCPEVHPISVVDKIIRSLTEEELRRATNEIFPRYGRRLHELNIHELLEALHDWRRKVVTNKRKYFCLLNGSSSSFSSIVSVNGCSIEAVWDTGSQASLISEDQVEEGWAREECRVAIRGLGGEAISTSKLVEGQVQVHAACLRPVHLGRHLPAGVGPGAARVPSASRGTLHRRHRARREDDGRAAAVGDEGVRSATRGGLHAEHGEDEAARRPGGGSGLPDPEGRDPHPWREEGRDPFHPIA